MYFVTKKIVTQRLHLSRSLSLQETDNNDALSKTHYAISSAWFGLSSRRKNVVWEYADYAEKHKAAHDVPRMSVGLLLR